MPVCLEVGSKATGAFVPSCPGCWVFGRDRESALNKVKVAVSDWYAWSKNHGEATEVPPTIRIKTNEVLQVTYNPAEAGKPEPLFWSEVLPVSIRDTERILRLLGYSRNDLLRLITGFDKALLHWKPKDGPRTIANCLRHIAMVEWWYVTRLGINLPTDFPKDTIELLSHTREFAEWNLSHLSKEKRTRIFQPKRDPSPICNLWTARKVLRRFVDHERLHTKYIEKTKEQYDRGSQSRLK